MVGINDGGVLGLDVGTLVDGWEVGCEVTRVNKS